MRPPVIILIVLHLLPIGTPISAQNASGWLGFRGDDARTGRAAVPGPDRATPGWIFRLDGVGYSSVAIGGDEALFVGSSDSLYAITFDGERIWAAPSGGFVVSSPALTSGAVYFGSRDNHLYAVRRSDGARLWRFPTGGEVWSSPAIGRDGTIYIGSFDGCLYAISPTGVQRWRRCTADGIAASPTLAEDGTIYIGSRDGYLYAIRPTGAEAWRVRPEPDHEIVSTAALGDDGAIYVSTRGGSMFALSPQGDQLWSEPYDIGAEVVASPALTHDGTIIIGDRDGRLHAVRPDGSPKWSSPLVLGSEILSSAAVDSRGTIYVGTTDERLFALEDDGSERWVVDVGMPVWASPAIGPFGMLFVSTTGTDEPAESGSLHAIASLEFDVESPEEAPAGQDVAIHIRIRDGLPELSARLFYRRGGERRFTESVPMAPAAPGLLEGVIPHELVSIRGVEYYLSVVGEDYRRTFPAFRPEQNPAVQRVRVGPSPADVDLQRRVYRMVSVPLELSETAVPNVLEDDYGLYTPSRWRLFRWENGQYHEHPNTGGSFTPGSAFFLATVSGAAFNTPEGRSTDTAQPYAISLQPGWNQIANPFAFPVSWDDVIRDEAVVDAIAFWDGREMRQDLDRITLLPWEGYFVHNRSPDRVRIEIPPMEAADPLNEEESEPRLVWRIEAHGPNGMQDTQNWIGFTGTERDESTPQAPAFDEPIRVAVIHDDQPYARLLHPGRDGASWIVEIDLAVVAERGTVPVDISIHPETPMADNLEIRVVDLDHDGLVSIFDGHFSVELTPLHPLRRLEIVIGNSDFLDDRLDGYAELPATAALRQNFPNPFNSATTIVFETTRPEVVRLDVFDVTGRRIATLAEGMLPPGRHHIDWDTTDGSGRKVASGIYVYRLQSESGTMSRTMTLVR
jgi:outer membrane protein assembly factor BamB